MFKTIWKVSKANTFLEQSLGYVTRDKKGTMRQMRELSKEFPHYESAELAFAYLALMHTGEIGAGIAEVSGTTDDERFSTLSQIYRQIVDAQKNDIISFEVYKEIYPQVLKESAELAEKLDPD